MNVASAVRWVLQEYPLSIGFKDREGQFECEYTTPDIKKEGLEKMENIYVTLFDTETMCLRGDDIEWCEKYSYTK